MSWTTPDTDPNPSPNANPDPNPSPNPNPNPSYRTRDEEVYKCLSRALCPGQTSLRSQENSAPLPNCFLRRAKNLWVRVGIRARVRLRARVRVRARIRFSVRVRVRVRVPNPP